MTKELSGDLYWYIVWFATSGGEDFLHVGNEMSPDELMSRLETDKFIRFDHCLYEDSDKNYRSITAWDSRKTETIIFNTAKIHRIDLLNRDELFFGGTGERFEQSDTFE